MHLSVVRRRASEVINATNRSAESPDTVHGRLLEAVHISGYTFERACSEFDWLITDERWKKVGKGYEDVNEFLATVDLSEFKIAIERRKKIAKKLAVLQASQRATAKALGVSHTIIQRDLADGGNKLPAGVPSPQIDAVSSEVDGNKLPPDPLRAAVAASPTAWFQDDVDPAKLAKGRSARAEKLAARGAVTDPGHLPTGPFAVVLADPPWRYEFSETDSRKLENQYETMDLPQIKALGETLPLEDDAVLFLWGTSPKLPEALAVMEAWGFTYVTCAVWVKPSIGAGYWFRQRHELLLVGKCGAPPVPLAKIRPDSVIEAARGKHSEKPQRVYELIEQMCPGLAKVELFGRGQRDGWVVWGDQA